MWFPQLLVLFAITSVGPGFFFLRRWRLGPAEKLVASVGLSYLLLYLGAFAVFAAGLRSRWQFLVMLLCLALTLACVRDLRSLFATGQVRRLLAAFGAFLAWGFLLLCLVRCYGGGTWSGDWLEHYERSLFFLGGNPRDFLFIERYPLPARPPLMNVVTAHFLALAGTDYYVYQVVSLFLNALVFLPCCLLARGLLRPAPRRGRRLPWMVLLVLAANPMVCQNLTYAWTKLFTAFYVLLALHLYLRASRRAGQTSGQASGRTPGLRARLVLAFASLCTGLLVHYSAGPYAAFVGMHYLLAVWRRRPRRLAEAATIAGVCGLVLASWFAWSVHAYGGKTTFASNSTVTDAAPLSTAENLQKVGKNLLDTIVPAVLRHPSLMTRDKDLVQPTWAGRVRDFAFLCYQVSVTFGLGSAGPLLVGYLLYRFLLRPLFPSAPFPSATAARAAPAARDRLRSERRFWAAFVPFVLVVGVAVHGGVDRFGVAHICLQPLVLLGLCLLAAGRGRIPAPLRLVLLPGLLLDLVLGVFLQFALENRTFATMRVRGEWVLVPIKDYLSRAAEYNWRTKVNGGFVFWGDYFAGSALLLQGTSVLLVAWIAWMAFRAEPGRAVAATARKIPIGPAARRAAATVPPRRRKARRRPG